jgi:hypothetical protein
MVKYLLANSDNHTWRGSQIFTDCSSFSSQASYSIVAENASEIGTSPLVAIMLNPWHAQLGETKMLELEFTTGTSIKENPAIKLNVREVGVPEVTTDQKIIFALMVITEVYRHESFTAWARSWINGSDRSAESASKLIADIGKYAKDANRAEETLRLMGVCASELRQAGASDNDFCVRASEAVFAAQMYVDRAENWPLLAARSVCRAVSGMGNRADLAAIAQRAIESPANTMMRPLFTI